MVLVKQPNKLGHMCEIKFKVEYSCECTNHPNEGGREGGLLVCMISS